MIRTVFMLSLVAASCVWAAAPAQPLPQVKSAAELAWEAIPDTIPDAEQVRVAMEYLDNNPNDIPLLRNVQNILNRKGDLTVEFWKERMDKNPTTANRYLYARKVGESDVMKAHADLIMNEDPNNFWGYYLAAVSELNKEKPDLNISVGFFEQAIAKDPSRPEGWYYCADSYEQLGNLDKALECYQAGLVVQPGDKSLKMSILGLYGQKRDADKYFTLAAELLPKEPPLQIDLGMHGSEHKMTASDFSGQYTVLEMFTHW